MKVDDVVSVVVGQPLGLAGFVCAEVFRSLFLGWLLSDFRETYFKRSLGFGSDVPLANLAGDVAVVRHERGQGRAILGNREPTGHAVLAEALAVLPHDQAAPARATGRVDDIGRGEAYPFLGQPVDVWGRDVFAVIASDVPVTQVIDVDEHDVGLVCGRQGNRREQASSGKGKEGEQEGMAWVFHVDLRNAG